MKSIKNVNSKQTIKLLLAQIKAGNSSYKLKNENRHTLSFLSAQ